MSFFMGLDLGQTTDYTAIAIAERITGPPKPILTGTEVTPDEQAGFDWIMDGVPLPPPEPMGPAVYQVRHLERIPLGTSYSAIVAHVSRLVRLPALRELRVAVDATGVGAPVVDLLMAERLPCPVYAIHIHGGDAVSHGGMRYRVPKRDLIASTQVLLQNNRLKIAAELPFSDTLVHELLNFRFTIDATTAHDTYNAREGQHDDLLLAACMALWLAEKIGDGPQIRAL